MADDISTNPKSPNSGSIWRAVPPRLTARVPARQQKEEPTSLLTQFQKMLVSQNNERLQNSLVAKDVEIQKLRSEVAEKDARLKAAKSDILEARLTVAEKDRELREVYGKLGAAAKEKSRLRAELQAVSVELQVTKAELEELANDILAAHGLEAEDTATLDAFGEGNRHAELDETGVMNLLQTLKLFSDEILADVREEENCTHNTSK